jgi:hypothetical protein
MKTTTLLTCTLALAGLLGAAACDRSEPRSDSGEEVDYQSETAPDAPGDSPGAGNVTCGGPGGSGENYVCYLRCREATPQDRVLARVESSEQCAQIARTMCIGDGGLVSCEYTPERR